jgi:hypothetical protein
MRSRTSHCATRGSISSFCFLSCKDALGLASIFCLEPSLYLCMQISLVLNAAFRGGVRMSLCCSQHVVGHMQPLCTQAFRLLFRHSSDLSHMCLRLGLACWRGLSLGANSCCMSFRGRWCSSSPSRRLQLENVYSAWLLRGDLLAGRAVNAQADHMICSISITGPNRSNCINA